MIGPGDDLDLGRFPGGAPLGARLIWAETVVALLVAKFGMHSFRAMDVLSWRGVAGMADRGVRPQREQAPALQGEVAFLAEVLGSDRGLYAEGALFELGLFSS